MRPASAARLARRPRARCDARRSSTPRRRRQVGPGGRGVEQCAVRLGQRRGRGRHEHHDRRGVARPKVVRFDDGVLGEAIAQGRDDAGGADHQRGSVTSSTSRRRDRGFADGRVDPAGGALTAPSRPHRRRAPTAAANRGRYRRRRRGAPRTAARRRNAASGPRGQKVRRRRVSLARHRAIPAAAATDGRGHPGDDDLIACQAVGDAGAAGAGREFGQHRRRVHDPPIPHRYPAEAMASSTAATPPVDAGSRDRCPVRAAAHRQHGVGDAEQVEFGQQSLADGQGQRVHTRGEAVGGAEVGQNSWASTPSAPTMSSSTSAAASSAAQGQGIDAALRLRARECAAARASGPCSAEAAQVGLVEDHHPGWSGPVKRGGVLGFDCLRPARGPRRRRRRPGQDGGTPAAQGPADGGAAGARSSAHPTRSGLRRCCPAGPTAARLRRWRRRPAPPDSAPVRSRPLPVVPPRCRWGHGGIRADVARATTRRRQLLGINLHHGAGQRMLHERR